MIPLFNTDGSSTCPLGFPMNQNRLAVPVWSYAMEVYPPMRIVELGSYNGGFTTALGVHAWRIKAAVYSFDQMQTPDEQWKSLAEFLHIKFYVGDLFANSDWIRALIQGPGVTYLLCDNGDKVHEFKLFAPFLKSGDVIAAHDYAGRPSMWPWSEIRPKDVAETVKANNLKPWMQEHFNLAGWLAYKKE